MWKVSWVFFPFSEKHNCKQKSSHSLQIALPMRLWTNNKIYIKLLNLFQLSRIYDLLYLDYLPTASPVSFAWIWQILTISLLRIWLIEKIMSKGPWPNNLVFKWWIIFIDKRFPWEFGAHCTKHQAAKVRWNCDKLHERWLCPPSVKVSFSNFCYLTAQSHDKCQLNGGQLNVTLKWCWHVYTSLKKLVKVR